MSRQLSQCLADSSKLSLLSWRETFSGNLPLLRSSARTVYHPPAARPQSLWHPCVSRQIWWIQVVGGRPQVRLHSCDGCSQITFSAWCRFKRSDWLVHCTVTGSLAKWQRGRKGVSTFRWEMNTQNNRFYSHILHKTGKFASKRTQRTCSVVQYIQRQRTRIMRRSK